MTSNAQAKLAARYGAPTISALQQWNDTIDQLLEHRSVRAFTDQPLPGGTLETLVAAAQSASTSSNLQVWSVVAVQEGIAKAASRRWPATSPTSIKRHCSWSGLPICPASRASQTSMG